MKGDFSRVTFDPDPLLEQTLPERQAGPRAQEVIAMLARAAR